MADRSKLIDSLRVEIELAEKVGANAAVVAKMEKAAQKIQRAIDRLNTRGPNEQMARLETVLKHMGGTSNLTEQQTRKLADEVERLAKAGAKVPAALQPAVDSMNKLRQAEAAAVENQKLKSGLLDKVGLGALSGMGPAAGGLLAVGAMAGVAKETFDLINSTADLADNVSDLATRYQISTDSVQQFQFMADRAGLTVEDFGDAIVNLTKNLDQAPEKFQRWGMDVEHLKSLKPDELLGAMAEKLKTLNESDRLTFSKELMKTTALLPVLLDDFDKLAAKARELGINLSEADISSLKEMRDGLDDLGTAWEGMWVQLGAALAQDEDVQEFFSTFQAGIVELANIIKENKAEIVSFAKLLTGMATMNVGMAFRGAAGLVGGPANTGGATGSWGDPLPRPKPPGQHGPDPAALAAAKRAADEAERIASARGAEELKVYQDFIHNLQAGQKAAEEASLKRMRAASASLIGSQFDVDVMAGPGADVKKRHKGFDTVGIIKDIQGVEREVYQLHKPTMQWSQFLQDAAAQFQLMGASGQAIGKIVGAMGGLGSIFSKGGALEGVSGVKSFLSGGFSLAKLSGGLSAAFAALDMGKMIFGMFHKSEAEKVAFDVGRDYGVKISEGLSKEIAANSKTMGRQAASLLSLDKIVGEAGGVQAFGLDKTTGKLRDLFSMIQTGKMTAEQAKGPFDKLFGEVVQASISKTTGLISAQAAELRDLADASGMQSDAVEKFKGEQRDVAAAIIGRLANNKDFKIANAQAGEVFGTALAAQYERMVKQGLSGLEIAEKLGPQIDALQKKFAEAGFGGGKAFEAMLGKVELFRDELTGPVAQGFQDVTGLAAALFNSGDLTKSGFQGLAGQAGAQFAELQARMTSEGKDPSAAFEMMAGDLQKLWEMQRRFNVDLDANTQQMLDQAQQSGVVGEEFMDPLLREAERTNEILERGFSHLGASFEDMPSRISERTKIPGDMAAYSAGTSGALPAKLQDTLASMATGDGATATGEAAGEAVVSGLAPEFQALGQAIIAAVMGLPQPVIQLDTGQLVGGVADRIERGGNARDRIKTALDL